MSLGTFAAKYGNHGSIGELAAKIERALALFEATLEASTSGFLVGDELSAADIVLAAISSMYAKDNPIGGSGDFFDHDFVIAVGFHRTAEEIKSMDAKARAEWADGVVPVALTEKMREFYMKGFRLHSHAETILNEHVGAFEHGTNPPNAPEHWTFHVAPSEGTEATQAHTGKCRSFASVRNVGGGWCGSTLEPSLASAAIARVTLRVGGPERKTNGIYFGVTAKRLPADHCAWGQDGVFLYHMFDGHKLVATETGGEWAEGETEAASSEGDTWARRVEHVLTLEYKREGNSLVALDQNGTALGGGALSTELPASGDLFFFVATSELGQTIEIANGVYLDAVNVGPAASV